MSEASSIDRRVKPLSAAQEKVLRFLSKDPNRLPRQLAGYGAAPHLSAARALVRKGLVRAGTRTGYYGITADGVEHLRLNAEAMRHARKEES